MEIMGTELSEKEIESVVQRLSDRWIAFCEENRLPLMSADELLAEYGSSLPLDMKRQIERFISDWEVFA
jgi:hypothetical protein